MGGLIIPEDKLREIISQMPPIDYIDANGDLIESRQIQFGWGTKKQLNEYLKLNKEDSYPLTWLLNPRTKTYKDQSSLVDRDCNIVIATLETRKYMSAMDRFNASFEIVLNPICELITQGIRSASTTRFLNDDQQQVNDFPDYSEEGNTAEAGSIEMWDAIRFDCRIEFNNNCLNNIKWITS